jgi:hypothetical protein
MSKAQEDASARARVLLAGMVSAALVLLLPSLLATSGDAPAMVGLAVVALALAAMVRFGASYGALSAGTLTAPCPTRRETLPLLPGRATDPVHHPLRPRAPGTV